MSLHDRGAAAPQIEIYKSTDFVDMILNILRDLPFSWNYLLKSADD